MNLIKNVQKTLCFSLVFTLLLGVAPVSAMDKNLKRNIKEVVSYEQPNKKKKLDFNELKKLFEHLMFEGDLWQIQKFVKGFAEDKNSQQMLSNIVNATFIYKNKKTTWLLYALKENKIDIALFLLTSQLFTCDTLNFRNPAGKNAFQEALKIKRCDVIFLLIECGFDLKNNCFKSNTPLMWVLKTISNYDDLEGPSTKQDLFSLARLLIEKGVNVHEKNTLGETALILAAPLGNSEIVQMIVEKGADLDSEDREGNDALSLAIQQYANNNFEDQFNIIKILVINGVELPEEGLDILLSLYQNERLHEFFGQIGKYHEKNDEDSLCKAITNENSELAPQEWLTYALIIGSHEHINTCIDKKICTTNDIDHVRSYLLMRDKTSEQLQEMVNKKSITSYQILCVLASYPTLFVKSVGSLLESTETEERKKIMDLAQHYENKKMWDKVVNFNETVRVLGGKEKIIIEDKIIKKKMEVLKKIASFEVPLLLVKPN